VYLIRYRLQRITAEFLKSGLVCGSYVGPCHHCMARPWRHDGG